MSILDEHKTCTIPVLHLITLLTTYYVPTYAPISFHRRASVSSASECLYSFASEFRLPTRPFVGASYIREYIDSSYIRKCLRASVSVIGYLKDCDHAQIVFFQKMVAVGYMDSSFCGDTEE
eukprot:6179255-Pleurochrysis_carterae.AAC.1